VSKCSDRDKWSSLRLIEDKGALICVCVCVCVCGPGNPYIIGTKCTHKDRNMAISEILEGRFLGHHEEKSIFIILVFRINAERCV